MESGLSNLADMKVTELPTIGVDALIPYAKNSRTHSEAQVAQIAASIREFGWTNPVLLDEDGTIIAGHGRILAARKLGMAAVPYLTLAGLTPAQRRAYVIADNKLALNAGWDDELLKVELETLRDEDKYDLAKTGFSEQELDELLQAGVKEGETDPDDIPETPAKSVSILGDVWVLGNHRIVCGDCTHADVVAKALNGVKPHLMVTDPPYGVEYDANWRNEADRANGEAIGARAVGKVLNDDKADWREAWALFPGDVAYVWHAGIMAGAVADSLAAAGFEIRSQIVWGKTRFAISRGHYHWQHEPCWYSVRKGATGHWAGDRKQTTLWQIAHSKSETGHSTQKPVEAMRRPMENNSSAGHAIYEPFSGSGTTIIAGEQTGRSVHAIELNPLYVDVAVTRWEKFTGKQAVNESTGKSFSETAALQGCNLAVAPKAD